MTAPRLHRRRQKMSRSHISDTEDYSVFEASSSSDESWLNDPWDVKSMTIKTKAEDEESNSKADIKSEDDDVKPDIEKINTRVKTKVKPKPAPLRNQPPIIPTTKNKWLGRLRAVTLPSTEADDIPARLPGKLYNNGTSCFRCASQRLTCRTTEFSQRCGPCASSHETCEPAPHNNTRDAEAAIAAIDAASAAYKNLKILADPNKMPGRKALIASDAPLALLSVNNVVAGSETWTTAQFAWVQGIERRLAALEKPDAITAAADAAAADDDGDYDDEGEDEDEDVYQPKAKPKRRARASLPNYLSKRRR
ncbi:hypothetical protein CP533_1656 [Ophiocordyceps camponoti-saundersi (nom. inval.)]|nr:hypothetical protein CP533_1656 [Ophiocordyceps camponoti-saundersi (nom. inval.)]